MHFIRSTQNIMLRTNNNYYNHSSRLVEYVVKSEKNVYRGIFWNGIWEVAMLRIVPVKLMLNNIIKFIIYFKIWFAKYIYKKKNDLW